LSQETSEKVDDRLEAIFHLQKGLSEMMNLDRYPKDSEGRISATNWKWWKTPVPFNEADAREELIDIWHFVVQASLELNLTPDDIVDEYKRKNEINRERQRTGY
jgi:dimeric dUTPase (all-alpha-NTP-PPase superfamily)